MGDIKYLDPGKKVVLLTRSGAVITQSGYAPTEYDLGNNPNSYWKDVVAVRRYKRFGLESVALWGNNNLKPLWLLELLSQSHINAQLIYTKVSLAVAHLFAFRWELRDDPVTGIPQPTKVPFDPGPEIRAILAHNNTRKLIRSRGTDFYITGNAFGVPMLARNPRYGVVDWKHIDASTARCEVQNPETKKVEGYYVCADWRKPRFKRENNGEYFLEPDPNVRRYNAFDPDQWDRYYQSIHHSRLYWTGEPYYGIQPWHYAFNWIGYGNQMPVWLNANIMNSFNIKYHIEYPDDYFAYLKEDFDTDAEREAEKERVWKKIDDNLMGAQNAQKSIKTPFKNDPMTGQPMAGWKITPLKNELHDDAFIRAFFASQVASISAHGLDQSLASIVTEGRMPTSGSDKRISYQLHEVLKTEEVRQIMVEPLEIMRDTRGWDPEMQFGFVGRNIVTLAEDKQGTTPQQMM